MPVNTRQRDRFSIQIRAFGGLNQFEEYAEPEDNPQLAFEPDAGFVAGAAFGFNLSAFTFEVEGSHRSADVSEITAVGMDGIPTDGTFTANSVMLNAWYNLNLTDRFALYFGGGSGISSVELDTDLVEGDTSGSASQLGAGARISLSDTIGLGLGYRYFIAPIEDDDATDYVSHDVIAELIATF